MPEYNCLICNNKSQQKSHHDTHINSERHKDKSKIKTLELEKLSKEELNNKYKSDAIDNIIKNLSNDVNKASYEFKKYKRTHNVLFKLKDNDLKIQQKEQEFKSKFKSNLKRWHNLLSGTGVTGDAALDEMMNLLMLCYLDNRVSDTGIFDLLNIEKYPNIELLTDFELSKKYLKIKNLLEDKTNLTKSSNINDGISKIEYLGELLSEHPLTKLIIKEVQFLKCNNDTTLYNVLKEMYEYTKTENIFQYQDLVGIAYEQWTNEYKGNSGKELGNYFTERGLMHMCFELIDDEDLNLFKINDKSTIGDEFSGTYGFPLYLKNYLETHKNIKIKPENMYGLEFEDRASKLGILNAMFSLNNIQHITRGDSFITNVTPHLDISIHNVPFGKRMKAATIEKTYNDNKKDEYPKFKDIIPVKENRDAILASQMVIYKTKYIGICIIKDGEETTGMRKKLIEFRKHFCDKVNIKKILKIPGGIFSSTGTKTICIYFIKDGNKTNNLKFIELDNECSKLTEMVNVSYDDLQANNFSWDPNTYILDEDFQKIKHKATCEFKPLGELCKIKYGERITKAQLINSNSNIYNVYGGGNKTFLYNKFNREGCTCKISRFGASCKNFVMILKDKYWLNDSGLTINSIDETIIINKYLYYAVLSFNNNEKIFSNLYKGSGQQNIDINEFNKLLIPTPSLEKQNITVEKLDDLNEMKQQLEFRKKGITRQMKYYFDDQIMKHRDNIEIVKLGDICEIKNGNFNSNDMDNKGIIPFYSCIAYNPAGFHSKYNFDFKEYLLLITNGGSRNNLVGDNVGLGKCYLVNGKTACRSGVCSLIIKLNNILYKYLFYNLNINRNFTNKIADFTTNLGTINKDKLKILNIYIHKPEQQNEIVKYLDTLEEEKNTIDKQINELDTLMKSILEHSYQ